MNKNKLTIILIAVAALLAFFALPILSSVLHEKSFLSEAWKMFSNPLGCVVITVPFLILAVACRIFLKNSGPVAHLILIVIAFTFTGLSFFAANGSLLALDQKKWTAAALSVGLMCFAQIASGIAITVVLGLISLYRKDRSRS